MSTANERVLEGIKLLDMEAPDWRSKIDLDQLSMRDTRYCILGQVFGDYHDGLNVLWPDEEAPAELYGFDSGYDDDDYIGYIALQAAWLEALTVDG